MIIDGILLIFIVLTALRYGHRGFVVSVVSFAQWAGGLILGLLFFGRVRTWLADSTQIDERMTEFFTARFADGFGQTAGYDLIPKSMNGLAGEAPVAAAQANSAAQAAASGLTRLILSVAAFFLIILAVKLAAWLICLPFRNKEGGPLRAVDHAAGGFLGILIGIFLCLLSLALLSVLMGVLPEGAAVFLKKTLDASSFSGILYQQNPLLLMIGTLL